MHIIKERCQALVFSVENIKLRGMAAPEIECIQLVNSQKDIRYYQQLFLSLFYEYLQKVWNFPQQINARNFTIFAEYSRNKAFRTTTKVLIFIFLKSFSISARGFFRSKFCQFFRKGHFSRYTILRTASFLKVFSNTCESNHAGLEY